MQAGALRVKCYSRPVRPGEKAVLLVDLHNTGDRELYGITITLQGVYASSIEVKTTDLTGLIPETSGPPLAVTGAQSYYFHSIDSGGYLSAAFEIWISEDADPGVYTITLTISYYDDRGEEHTLRYYPGITVLTPIKRPESIEPSRAHIAVITAYSSSSPVIIGSDFSLIVQLKNLGSVEASKLKVELKLKEEAQQESEVTISGLTIPSEESQSQVTLPFIPVNGSNALYYGSIDPDETVTVIFNLTTDINADPGAYMIPLILDYFDSYGNEYVETVYIGVKISRVTGIGVYDWSTEPYPLEKGKSGILRFRVANTGREKVYGISFSVLTGVIKPLSPAYVGDLDAGETDDVYLKLEVPDNLKNGLYNLTVLGSYQDEFGNSHEERFTITVKIGEGSDNSVTSTRISYYKYVIPALLAVLMVFLALKLRKKSSSRPIYEPRNIDVSKYEDDGR